MIWLGFRDVLFLSLCGAIHFVYRYRRKLRVPLPPSLPGWPIIGNAFQMPLTYPHLFFKELGERLGSKIIYLGALGNHVVVINDVDIARELLERRSGLYSSRPRLTMVTEVVKAKMFFGFMPYGDTWRTHRRIFQQYFSPKTLKRDQETTLEFVRKALLPNIIGKPHDIHEHVRGCVGGLAIAITYGTPVRRTDEPFVDQAEKAFMALTAAAGPGNYLVNVLPVLKYVPGWIPGVTFKRVAREIHRQINNVIEDPYQKALSKMDDGTAKESFISENLEKIQNAPNFELLESCIKEIGSTVYGTMAETTVAATMTFVLAMLKHPQVQRKAQQEVDSVVGLGRLPDFSDQPHLPYLAAVLKEVLRWNPVLPAGVPHMASEEDIYQGYYIPKNSTVLANIYAMLHDEEVFPNPTEFKPDRFIRDGILSTDVLDPTLVATFGFGRRICPGSHIGLSTLYIIAASILYLFDISPALDAEGRPIEVKTEFIAASLVSEPLPFKCKFVSRQGKDAEKLLQDYSGNEYI